MIRKYFGTFGLAMLTVLGSATIASAQVRIVNLSGQDAYIARSSYSSGQSSIPAGEYNLPSYSPEGWSFNGWWKIAPGETYQGPAGSYYVKQNGRPLTWNGPKNVSGFVKSGKFNAFVSRGGWQKESQKLLQEGYQKATYQQLDSRVWTISGSAYRMRTKTFDFDFSSRSINFHNKSYQVPGTISSYDVSASQWRAKGVTWNYRNDKIWVTLSTEGAQRRPFGPREPGYYRGKVTVHYTERS